MAMTNAVPLDSRFRALLLAAAMLTLPAFWQTAAAQFEEPVFRKIEKAERAMFESRFADILWTGQGLYNQTTIDRIPTMELRARLQTRFGDPTVRIEDLMGQANFRPAKAIQFEYWFVVDGTMPLMVLDLDGPFENGLVYVGASRYADQMPQVKRTLTRLLMQEADVFTDYEDHFYSPERDQWYLVSYLNGKFNRKPVDAPAFANP